MRLQRFYSSCPRDSSILSPLFSRSHITLHQLSNVYYPNHSIALGSRYFVAQPSLNSALDSDGSLLRAPKVVDQVSLHIPATTANMGPGYDSFGMAVDLHNKLTVSRADKFSVEIFGEGKNSLATDENNLIVKACGDAYNALGFSMPPLKFSCTNYIPNTRGLGSSSAALVGGLAAGLVLCGKDLHAPATKQLLLQMAAEIEGHPDNVAPAIYGGFQVAIKTEAGWITQRINVPAGLQTVLFIPDMEMRTSKARGILKDDVPRSSAVFNLARASMLVNCFSTGRLEALRYATCDALHQPQRGTMFPIEPIVNAALDSGAHGAWLSGAGSTIMAITGGHGTNVDADTLATAMAQEVAHAMSTEAKKRDITGRIRITTPVDIGIHYTT